MHPHTFLKKYANEAKVHVGAIRSKVHGRTDHLNMNVPDGAYVVTADVVSALGEGNTLAGFDVLDSFVNKIQDSLKELRKTRPVEIVAAGGEYVIPSSAVKVIGGGNLQKGHSELDKLLVGIRKETIKKLQKLPSPKKD